MISSPLVSVVCVTYNHEKFLRQALDGFLMQKTSFPVEIILAEDCSTDGTRKICEEYKAKYPEQINYIFSDHNVGPQANELRAMQAVRGKYIAYCEGDDYWTEPNKLQWQVDFMESHPEYSVCWHRFRNFNVETGEEWQDRCHVLFDKRTLSEPDTPYAGIDVDMNLYFSDFYTQPLTMLYRTDALDLRLYDRFKYFRDMHQMYFLLRAGKGRILSFNGACHISHKGGIASMISKKQYSEVSLPTDREFFWKTLDFGGPRHMYMATLDAYLCHRSKDHRKTAFRCAFARFVISGHPHLLFNNLMALFKR